MSTYEVTDATGSDLLGCEQPDLDAARIAARTLVLEGEESAHIYEVIDGERARFPMQTAEPNGRGGVLLRGAWGR